MSTRIIEGHHIELANEDKILFPQTGITKGDLIAYYQFIAPHMLTFIANHPLAMQRYPDGISKEGFYQKERGDYFPKWIKSVPIARLASDQVTNYIICNDAATLVYLANQAVITFHIWLSTTAKKNYPDRMIFDIDPPTIEAWPAVRHVAMQLRHVLQTYDLVPFVMTTGSKGLHVVVPLKQTDTFKTVYQFARRIAQRMVQQHPELITLELHKKQRTDKIFIDVLRNQWAQLGVAPYSVRVKEGAPVATPLHWHELQRSTLNPQRYNIGNIKRRLSTVSDAWQNFYQKTCSIPKKE